MMLEGFPTPSWGVLFGDFPICPGKIVDQQEQIEFPDRELGSIWAIFFLDE